MFVVIRNWGEYSDRGERVIGVCSTEEKANKLADLLKRLDQFSIQQSELLQAKLEVWKKDNLEPISPTRPHKSTIDPKGLITNSEWLKIIEKWKKSSEGRQVEFKIWNAKRSEFEKEFIQSIEIPEDLKMVASHLSVNTYHFSGREPYWYSIEEAPFFGCQALE